MAISMGTNGARGLLDELGPSEALDLGYGFGIWCKENFPSPKNGSRHSIAVARDMRLTSPMLSEAAMAGVMEAGCDAIDVGLAASPVAEWASEHYDCDGLIIVTASHNPPEWNALKFVDANGVAVSKERGAGIAAFVGKKRIKPLGWKEIGSRSSVASQVHEDYFNAVMAFVEGKSLRKGIKVIFDPGNGTSALIVPRLLTSLGAKVAMINGPIDGTFPNRPSEPTEKNVAALIEKVKKEGADFGVACDGDADRIIFVDPKGRWMVGDKCVALHCAWALKKLAARQKGVASVSGTGNAVITTVATSKVVEDVASEYGAHVRYVKVGAPYISEAMLEENASFGGEEVGGIIYPDFSLAKDGPLAAAMMLEIVSEKPLDKWHDSLPVYFNAKTKIECKAEQKKGVLEHLAKELPLISKGAKANLVDGVRLDFADSWAIVRASGTENYFRVFAEAKTQDAALKLMNKYADVVRKALQ